LATFCFRINSDWLNQNHPNERRFGSVIFEADNVLKPEVIQTIFRIRQSMQDLVTPSGATWSDLCLRVPSMYKLFLTKCKIFPKMPFSDNLLRGSVSSNGSTWKLSHHPPTLSLEFMNLSLDLIYSYTTYAYLCRPYISI
jgi:hypothetical protein